MSGVAEKAHPYLASAAYLSGWRVGNITVGEKGRARITTTRLPSGACPSALAFGGLLPSRAARHAAWERTQEATAAARLYVRSAAESVSTESWTAEDVNLEMFREPLMFQATLVTARSGA